MANLRKYSLPINIAQFFFETNCISGLQTYLFIIYRFSGKFHLSQKSKLAQALGTSKNNAHKRIKRLVELQMLEERSNGWFYAIGKKRFNIRSGYCRSKMVELPEDVLKDKIKLRTFLYAVKISQAARHVQQKQRQKRENAQPLAGIYLARWLDKSVFTAFRQRKKASKLGFITVQEQVKVLERGGSEFRAFVFQSYQFNHNQNRCKLRFFNGLFELIEVKPSLVSSNLSLYSIRHNYSREQLNGIKQSFAQRCR